MTWLITSGGWLAAAILGLGMWRFQLIAKRRYEVAEQALTAVDSKVTALHHIRRAEADADAFAVLHPETLRQEPWFATYTRLQLTETGDSNIGIASKSIVMHFGDEAAKPFLELQAIRSSISVAHSMLFYGTPSRTGQREEWERTVREQGDSDPMTQRIDEIDRQIKKRFGRHLRPDIWRLFLPIWS